MNRCAVITEQDANKELMRKQKGWPGKQGIISIMPAVDQMRTLSLRSIFLKDSVGSPRRLPLNSTPSA